MTQYVCMYVEGVGQKSGPCTATFNDLLCFPYNDTVCSDIMVDKYYNTKKYTKVKKKKRECLVKIQFIQM
jgi:hypothetical protein